MDELGQGGMSRLETTRSARTRCSARVNGTCSSLSTPTRARMRSRASSTEITRVLYRGRRRLRGLAEDWLVLRDEPPPAQREEREEPGGDQRLADPQRKGHVLVERGEDDQDALDEDGDPAHEEDNREDLVARRRASRQPLQQVRERNEPADDEDGPGDVPPRRVEEAAEEESRLDGHVAVPDHEVL